VADVPTVSVHPASGIARHIRRVQNLPVQSASVRLDVALYRLRRRNPSCGRKTLAEPLEPIAAREETILRHLMRGMTAPSQHADVRVVGLDDRACRKASRGDNQPSGGARGWAAWRQLPHATHSIGLAPPSGGHYARAEQPSELRYGMSPDGTLPNGAITVVKLRMGDGRAAVFSLRYGFHRGRRPGPLVRYGPGTGGRIRTRAFFDAR
jgi:hypothetical protein